METYDLYGTRTVPLEGVRAAIERALGVQLERHESSYRGGDYFLGGDLRGENFVIQRNHAADGDEDDVAEAQFADYPVLVLVNATTRGDDLKARLTTIEGLDFLRRSVP